MSKKNKVATVQPKKAVMPVEDGLPTSIESLISRAIDKGTPVETMEKILAMAKDVKAQIAKEKFDQAMANFQAECPVIEKKKKVYEKGQERLPEEQRKVRYKYAPIDSIIEQVKKYIAENGLSYTLNVKQENGMLTVVCRVKHVLGHFEDSEFTVPIGAEQYMSDVQKYGARSTFAKRYAFCNAFGIMTGDEDTDSIVSNGTPPAGPQNPPQDMKQPETITPKQVDRILELSKALRIFQLQLEKQIGKPLLNLTWEGANNVIQQLEQAMLKKGAKMEAKPEVKEGQVMDEPKIGFECVACTNPINQAEKEYSEKQFGKALCRGCQSVEKKYK